MEQSPLKKGVFHIETQGGGDGEKDRESVKEKEPKKKRGKKASSTFQVIWETIRYVLIAALIIVPIRTFIAQPFVVSGNSMYPTFQNGEYLIVNELAKYIDEYRRGDVVILRYPNDTSKYFIKRVIGLPGETVKIEKGVVSITKPGENTSFALDEPYVRNMKSDNFSRTLTADEYFVMGDNRAQSSDSRIWGPVPAEYMDGKALLRLFPLTQIAVHPGFPGGYGVSYQ